jgi:hypothetical protein
MNKKFLIAWLVIFVLWMIGGFVVHGTLLNADYQAMGTMRPEAEQQSMMALMLLAHAVLAGGFVWIYARGVENKPWLGQGLRFGFAVACIAVIPVYLIYYVVLPTPSAVACKQIVFNTILTLILGAVVAFLYRGQGRA